MVDRGSQAHTHRLAARLEVKKKWEKSRIILPGHTYLVSKRKRLIKKKQKQQRHRSNKKFGSEMALEKTTQSSSNKTRIPIWYRWICWLVVVFATTITADTESARKRKANIIVEVVCRNNISNTSKKKLTHGSSNDTLAYVGFSNCCCCCCCI